MKLFINGEQVTEGSISAVRECVAFNEPMALWFDSMVEIWNPFYKRAELMDVKGNLWALQF